MKHHHRLAAVRAHLHEKAGDLRAAVAGYVAAANATSSLPEKNYLMMKAARIAPRDAPEPDTGTR